MTTVVIIVAVALVAVCAAAFLYTRQAGGQGMRRRFGPEYDRAVVTTTATRRPPNVSCTSG